MTLDESLKESYDRGYAQGIIDGREKARLEADRCLGCAFVHVEEWENPCKMCKRNMKDYWRVGVKEKNYEKSTI